MRPLPALRERVTADFTGWENDNAKFEAAFETLVRILQVDRSGRKAPPERAP